MAQRSFGPGSAESSQGLTFAAFFSSLAFSLAIFLVQMSLFLYLRRRLPHIYEPKSLFLSSRPSATPSPSHRPSSSVFGWLPPLFSVPLDQIKTQCTLDEYFFLRFLYLLLFLFTCATCVILPLLGAVNWISSDRYGSLAHDPSTIDNFSWVNIAPQYSTRRSTHLACAILLTFFISWLIYFELNEYVKIRQHVLSSPVHRRKPSSKTVLLRSVPSKYLTEDKIRELFEIFPGCVKEVSINRDFSPLVKLINERAKAAKKLECMENYIVWKSNKSHLAAIKKSADKAKAAVTKTKPKPLLPEVSEKTASSASDTANSTSTAISLSPYGSAHYTSPSVGKRWTLYIKESEIPKVRLPSFRLFKYPVTIPFHGLQIDMLSWLKMELNRLNAEIKAMQENQDLFTPINSCFVQFHHQVYAHLACQSIVFENPQLAGQSFIEIDPNDINWNNLDLSWLQCFCRRLFATILNILIILGWTFPVALIAILSQLDYLPELSHGFLWVDYIPARFRIMLSAILPSLAVSSLMRLAPMVFRYLARIKGFASYTQVDLDVQKYLFGFIFIQVFLVISLSRGMTAVVAHVLFSPFSALALLAANLPKGANFFYSYIFLQGLSLSGDTFLQTGRLFKVYIYRRILDRTPHQKFNTMSTIGSLQLGSIYPNITCLAIIGVVYSVIAPLITLFSTITFGLLYVAYKYRILYCNNPISDSGGLHFPKAIFQLATGIYCLGGCLIGLFLTTRDEDRALNIVFAVIMAASMVFTGILHYRIRSVFVPIIKYMPISLHEIHKYSRHKNVEESPCSESPARRSARKKHRVVSQTASDAVHSAASRFLPSKHSRSFSNLSQEKSASTRSFSTGSRYSADFFSGFEDDDEADQPPHHYDEAQNDDTCKEFLSTGSHFSHYSLRAVQPCIWIPEDKLGVSHDQIREVQHNYPHIIISNGGCAIDESGNVSIYKVPPDFSPSLKFSMYPY